MFDFISNTILELPCLLIEALPDFPSNLLDYQTNSDILPFLLQAIDFCAYVLPIGTICSTIIVCETILHWRIIYSGLNRIREMLPMFH